VMPREKKKYAPGEQHSLFLHTHILFKQSATSIALLFVFVSYHFSSIQSNGYQQLSP